MTTLIEVADLARLLVEADRSVETADQELSARKENARRLREEALPGALQELGITELKLDDGSEVTMGLEVYCSITGDKREEAHRWLDKHNFGGLIKTEITIPFGRDSTAQVEEARALLAEAGYGFSEAESVHPQTLKAWLKEQLREGAKNVPLQLFGARPVTVAKVKLPKGK